MIGAANEGSKQPAGLRDMVLGSIGTTLSRCIDDRDLYRALYQLTAQVVDTTGFILGFYDQPLETLTVVYQIDSDVELPGGSFPMGSGFTSQVVRTREPILIQDWSAQGPRVRIQYASDHKGLPESGITVPLLLGSRVLGFISVQSYKPGAYDETNLLQLQLIAAQAAVAIHQMKETADRGARLPRRVSELETIIAGMSEGLLVVNADGCITDLNHVARRLLCPDNGSNGIVLGQPLDRELWGQWPLGPRSVALAVAPLIDALRQGESLTDLEVDVLSDGRQVFSFSCAPLRGASGELTGGVIVFRDVTGRRELERMKDEMLSIASHELKSPITVIKGQAQLLRRKLIRGETTTETMDQGLETIIKHSDRLVGLLNLLLDLSRIEAGRFDLQPSPANLIAIAEEAIQRVQATSSRHKLILNAPPSLEGVWDTRRLEQLFQNILSNAVKYSPNGGPVEVSVLETDGQAQVWIRDEGIGIPVEELPHIFDRYYRAEGVRKLEGTGLGLYICERIVAAHGGRIWAESPGTEEGSVFSFILPLEPRNNAAEGTSGESAPSNVGGLLP